MTVLIAQGIPSACIKVKEADQIVVNPQCLDQFLLAVFILLLLKLLSRTIQKEPLIEQFSVLLKGA